MRFTRVIRNRLLSVFQRNRVESSLEDEIELHVEALRRELIAEGMSESNARLEARRQFGSSQLTKEHCRDMRGVNLIEDLRSDLLYALRLFRKSPGFTLTAIVSLALGIGANSAIFQLFDAVRLRSLPVQRPDELAFLGIRGEGKSGNFRGRNGNVTNAIWTEFQRRQQTFSGVVAYGDTPLNLAPSGELRNVEGLWVSGSFFPVLEIQPQLGRLLTPADDRPGCGWPGVVLSHAFWQREFGGDPNVTARTLSIDGRAVPVLGVTQAQFFGVEVGRRFDVAMPICSAPTADLNNRMFWFLSVMGRLKPGVRLDTARAELAAISAGVFEATVPPYSPDAQKLYAKLQFDLLPGSAGQSGLRESIQGPLAFLLCLVVCVLLLACANLANMMLARATSREHEFAVRVSLGATRGRLVRQLLMEGLLLSAVGALLGAALAPAISQSAVAMLSTARDPLYLDLDSNWRVLTFMIAAAVAATVLFGLAPALRAGRTEARGSSASHEKFAFRHALLVAQVSLCMIILTTALLFTKSFRNLLKADAGFEPQGILVASTFFRATSYPPERRQPAIEDLHRRLQALPGVSGIARSYVIPISGSGWDRSARVKATDQPQETDLTSISDRYFHVMNIPLLSGRDFNSSDRPSSAPVVIVNQEFSNRFFGGRNPIGSTFYLDGIDRPLEIVGLAGNTKYTRVGERFGPIAYLPDSQEVPTRLTVRYILRSNGRPDALRKPVEQVLASVDPQLTVRFAVLKTQIEESLLRERLMAALTIAFGVLAAVLALTGVFGVTAYVVARRYREFGVRMALGATGATIIRMVLGELAILLAGGMLIGGVIAVMSGTAAAAMLYGVQPYDALTIVTVLVLLGTGGLLAGFIPARRAAAVAPVEVLRCD